MSNSDQNAQATLLLRQVGEISSEMKEMRAAMKELVEVSVKQAGLIDAVAVVQHRQDRFEDRLRELEIRQPQLMEGRTWLVTAVAFCGVSAIGAVAALVWSMATKSLTVQPATAPAPQAQATKSP